MALKLVELGTDVNCKDSVGGERPPAWATGGRAWPSRAVRGVGQVCSGRRLGLVCCLQPEVQRTACLASLYAGHPTALLTPATRTHPSPSPHWSHILAGTAMHHAAMANKKEMMFALARLGCDWRARADGIEGATASFVLCGQHGKTTRQQVGGRLGQRGHEAVCLGLV